MDQPDDKKPPKASGFQISKKFMSKPMVAKTPAGELPAKPTASPKPMTVKTPAKATPAMMKPAGTAKMACPKCGVPLETITFREVQIDQCTRCRGVWLDPGELTKIAEDGRLNFLEKVTMKMIQGDFKR